jgi:hypothetical protein
MPRLMSVRPTASQTRTFEGTGIMPPLQHVEHTPQCRRIDAAAEADTILAGKINLDRLRDRRWLRDGKILFRRKHHRDQLGSRWDGRRTRFIAIKLSPTEYLVRIHVVMPRNH